MRKILPILAISIALAACGQTAMQQFTQGQILLKQNKVEEGIKLIKSASDEGLADAQLMLGYVYLKGELAKQDLGLANVLFRKAAIAGNTDAQYNLALLYYNGEGVKQDFKEAARWLTEVSEAGDPSAQFILARMYTDGKGVAKDMVRAYTWLSIAAESGHAEAVKNKPLLEKRLSADERHRAERMILVTKKKIEREHESRSSSSTASQAPVPTQLKMSGDDVAPL